MERSPSAERPPRAAPQSVEYRLPDDARLALLDLAAGSVLGAVHDGPFAAPDGVPVSPDGMPAELFAGRGVFVTVTVGGELNGCVGAVETDEPLVVSVPRLARQAAFADPRLPALRAVEVPDAAIKVSVLGPLEPIDALTPEDVATRLRLGVDGLLLRSGNRQATFLPGVAESLPGALDFVACVTHPLWMANTRSGDSP